MPEDDSNTEIEQHYAYVLKRCDAFSAERKTLLDTLLSVTERFDKWLIGLPAGAAGLTLVFYEKVASKAELIDLRILAWSWGLLCLGIGLGFLSLFLSTLAVAKQVVILDEEHTDFLKFSTPKKPQGKKRRKPLKNQWTPWTATANLISAGSSIVGIVLFLYFGYKVANTITKHQENERERQTAKESGIRPTDEHNATSTAAAEDNTGGVPAPSEPTSSATAEEIKAENKSEEPTPNPPSD